MNRAILRVSFANMCLIGFLYACTSSTTMTNNDSQSSSVTKHLKAPDIEPVKSKNKDISDEQIQQNVTPSKTTQEISPVKHNDIKHDKNPAESQTAFTFNNRDGLNPNRFNRLLEKNRSDTSKLHDPTIPSFKYLQKPSEAFADLPKANTGNKVDWVKAVETGKINPRHDLYDPNIKPVVMDLNIIMQVKGSMPDVVFPHRDHTRWLDCSNCHPAIFIPQSGANKMSMADNLLGQKCGVCHGKVAFPLSSCTKCHSNKKIIVQEKK